MTNWTPEEAVVLLRNRTKTWKDISTLLTGRTAQACKLWYSHISKIKDLTREERNTLRQFGESRMQLDDIAAQFPGQTPKSCSMAYKMFWGNCAQDWRDVIKELGADLPSSITEGDNICLPTRREIGFTDPATDAQDLGDVIKKNFPVANELPSSMAEGDNISLPTKREIGFTDPDTEAGMDWTPSETETLLRNLSRTQTGKIRWRIVSKFLCGRTTKACGKWYARISKIKDLTLKERASLRKLMESGMRLDNIAEKFPGQTSVSCSLVYKMLWSKDAIRWVNVVKALCPTMTTEADELPLTERDNKCVSEQRGQNNISLLGKRNIDFMDPAAERRKRRRAENLSQPATSATEKAVHFPGKTRGGEYAEDTIMVDPEGGSHEAHQSFTWEDSTRISHRTVISENPELGSITLGCEKLGGKISLSLYEQVFAELGIPQYFDLFRRKLQQRITSQGLLPDRTLPLPFLPTANGGRAESQMAHAKRKDSQIAGQLKNCPQTRHESLESIETAQTYFSIYKPHQASSADQNFKAVGPMEKDTPIQSVARTDQYALENLNIPALHDSGSWGSNTHYNASQSGGGFDLPPINSILPPLPSLLGDDRYGDRIR